LVMLVSGKKISTYFMFVATVIHQYLLS